MVPVNTNMNEKLERIETNLKYLIDLDLSEGQDLDDPLALALYYHFCQKNQLQNINTTGLVTWARTYCYEKLVLLKFSKKKDTELTAAILAYSTLKQDKGFPEEKKRKIEENITGILSQEKDPGGTYFGRPNFTAIIFYSAKTADLLPDEATEKQIKSLVETYKKPESRNNLLGLPFLTSMLTLTGQKVLLDELIPVLKKELENHLHDYDDKLYIVHSLWTYHSNKKALDQIQDLTTTTIGESPITVSDIINKGEISDITVREDNRKISRLYKALLIDLVTDYQKHLETLTSKKLDERYSRETSLKWGAFTTFTLLSILPVPAFIFLTRQKLSAALSFWLMQETNTNWTSLSINTGTLIVAAYLIVFAIVGTFSLYSSIIRKQIVKDLRVWEHYKTSQKQVTKKFLKYIFTAVVLGIIAQLAVNAFQNFISNKP